MTVQFQMIEQTTTTGDMPTAAPVTYTTGINAPGGPVEFLIMRFDMTFAGDPASAGFSNLVDSLRVILNGEVVHDFRAGYAASDNDGPGLYQYFLNGIGGRAYELPGGTTTREGYYAIPIGRQTPNGVNRYEIVVGWAAAAQAITSGSLSWWLRTNTAMQQTTTVCPTTSFTHAVALEQVVVRVPQNVPGTVAGILIQNDSAADEFGTQGVRINAMGPYGMEASMWRWLNGDLANGIMYSDPGLTTVRQEYAYQVPGGLFLPTFGLTGGDVVLQVDSSSATTRTYTPVLTHQVGARQGKDTVQTEAVPGNTARTILARAEN